MVFAVTCGLAGAADAKEAHPGVHSHWAASEPLLLNDGNQMPGGCPIESPGGKFLFTARNPGTGLDIFVNQRPGKDNPFAPGHQLPEPANDPALANDFCPTPQLDGELYFVSSRDNGCGSADIQVTINNPVTGYAEPINLGCAPLGPNTPGLELSPSILKTRRHTYLFYSTDYYTGNQDIYVSRMNKDGQFGEGKRLPWPINTEYDDRQPNVRQDGREIVFASDRPSVAGDDTGFDIFSAKRGRSLLRWHNVVNLSETVPFDTVDDAETRPSISWDGERLVYGSGGVWISERHK
ncbi:MAG: TolB family protein [bacterium]